jgi:hypothetical protein
MTIGQESIDAIDAAEIPLSKCEAYNRVYEQPCGSS